VPALHQRRILLIGTVQRALSSEPELPHDLAQRRQAQRHLKLPFDQAQGPQPEIELQLIGRAVANRICNPAQLIRADLRRPTRAFSGKQRVLTTVVNAATHLKTARTETSKWRATSLAGIPARTILTPCMRIHCCSMRREVKTGLRSIE